jgi:hypothetical protein
MILYIFQQWYQTPTLGIDLALGIVCFQHLEGDESIFESRRNTKTLTLNLQGERTETGRNPPGLPHYRRNCRAREGRLGTSFVGV